MSFAGALLKKKKKTKNKTKITKKEEKKGDGQQMWALQELFLRGNKNKNKTKQKIKQKITKKGKKVMVSRYELCESSS